MSVRTCECGHDYEHKPDAVELKEHVKTCPVWKPIDAIIAKDE